MHALCADGHHARGASVAAWASSFAASMSCRDEAALSRVFMTPSMHQNANGVECGGGGRDSLLRQLRSYDCKVVTSGVRDYCQHCLRAVHAQLRETRVSPL